MTLSAHSPTSPKRRCASAALALVVAALWTAVVAAPAQAAYGPGAEAASARGPLLGDNSSTTPSISDNGRFVVFSTQSINLLGRPPSPDERYAAGLVRRDMVTGAVVLVAPPRRVSTDGTILTNGAFGAASISGNGRYVVFDTTDQLTAGDQNTGSDVYVRDMTRALSDGSAYELASALDGTDAAPDYLDDNRERGSRSGRQGFAISDDGRRVVFRTEARSTLPAPAATLAPAQQVLVRLLDSKRTLLVTRNAADGTPVVPAASPPAQPAPVLSGDGSTVAWVDTNVAAQTTLLPGEPIAPAVLWRRIDAGDAAPTRRVAGLSDPDDPGCPPGSPFPAGGNIATGPCFGPFVVSEAAAALTAIDISPLSISDDGRRVLFLSKSQERPFDEQTAGDNVFLADMSAGLPRKQGVRRIVRALGQQSIIEVALDGAGTRVAFVSPGLTFEGGRAVGTFPTGVVQARNVFVLDLDQGTLQLATIGADGTDLRGQTVDPLSNNIIDPFPSGLALSDDGASIAFSAQDANLFLGDANGVADVEVVRGDPGVAGSGNAVTAAEPPSSALPRSARSLALKPLPRVHVVIGRVDVDARGVARLNVRVPAAGRVTATSSAAIGARKRLRVSRATRRTRAEATVHLRLAPTLKARMVTRRTRRLRVRVDVRYVPRSGRATATVRSYTWTRSAAR